MTSTYYGILSDHVAEHLGWHKYITFTEDENYRVIQWCDYVLKVNECGKFWIKDRSYKRTDNDIDSRELMLIMLSAQEVD